MIIFREGSRWWGGAETSLSLLLREAHEQRLDFRLVQDWPGPHQQRFGVADENRILLSNFLPFVRGLGRFLKWRASSRFAKILSAYPPATVHINLLRDRFLTDILIAKSLGWKVVGHYRRHVSSLDKKVIELCDTIICVSQWVEDGIKELVPDASTVVIHNGVDIPISVNPNPRADRSAIAKKHALDPDSAWVLFPATIQPAKGHEVALKAFRRIIEGRKAYLLLLGAQPPHHRVYKARLEEMVSSLELTEHVKFLGYEAAVDAYYGAADFVIVPTPIGEGFGRAIAEAGSFQRAVIAATTGAAPEIIDQGRTGLLVQPNDAEDLYRAMRSLIEDPAFAQKLGTNARQRVQQVFTASKASKAAIRVLTSTRPTPDKVTRMGIAEA